MHSSFMSDINIVMQHCHSKFKLKHKITDNGITKSSRYNLSVVIPSMHTFGTSRVEFRHIQLKLKPKLKLKLILIEIPPYRYRPGKPVPVK